MVRRLVALTVAAAAALGLAACSPPVAGHLGLEVRDGRLLLLAWSCENAIVDVQISADEVADGFLEAERIVLDPAPGGLAEHDLGPVAALAASLDPDAVYSIRGRAEGTSGRASGPAVTVDDLAGLASGVLYPRGGAPLEHTIGSVEEFADAAPC